MYLLWVIHRMFTRSLLPISPRAVIEAVFFQVPSVTCAEDMKTDGAVPSMQAASAPSAVEPIIFRIDVKAFHVSMSFAVHAKAIHGDRRSSDWHASCSSPVSSSNAQPKARGGALPRALRALEGHCSLNPLLLMQRTWKLMAQRKARQLQQRLQQCQRPA